MGCAANAAHRVTPVTIRRANLSESPLLARHRRAMFRAMGYRDEAALEAMELSFAEWVREKLASGVYFAWLALHSTGEPIAGAGVWLMDWPPHMVGPGAPRANILNIYVEPEWRRQGIARQLTQTALDFCRERGIGAVILHASPEGRALYESLGFTSTNEMRLMIDPRVSE
ncbi:MAG: GNAT family N-acetyltransferase [Bryobacteraceae bacterium]